MMRKIAILAALLCCAASASGAKGAPLYPTKDCGRYTAQMDMNMCANDNADAADTALNALYKQVAASKNAEDKASLKQAERFWIKYRDKTCNDQVGPQADGGSIWPMEWANCQETETAKRIVVLKRMLTCTAGASVCNPH